MDRPYSASFILLIFLSFCPLSAEVSKKDLQKIGEQIWENESHKSYEKLLFWNAKEGFASLGIGHFIWYHKDHQFVFEETFPKLLQFISNRQIKVPDFLATDTHCPWKNRAEFLTAKNDSRMKKLHTFLKETIDLQVLFMFERFKATEKELVNQAKNPKKIQLYLEKLSQTPAGLYALIDYTNFKGTGLSSKERYENQGWGLLQVLEAMREEEAAASIVKEFVLSAKKMLELRVKNAPLENREGRWLKGWFYRLETYSKGI